MLDHIGLRVADQDRSKSFYEVALAPLGFRLLMEGASGVGLGRGPIPAFWIKVGTPAQASRTPDERAGCGGAPVHVAFVGESRTAVDAFHRAALAAGGRDNGVPRLRPEYHANYYAAFVLDPDGYNVEAVCHRAE